MKKKLSFVTNSSSTSFCIIGINTNMGELEEVEGFFDNIGFENYRDSNVYDFAEFLRDKTNLETYSSEDGTLFIGHNIDYIDRNKSINDNIIEVRHELNKLGFPNEILNNIDIIADTVYD